MKASLRSGLASDGVAPQSPPVRIWIIGELSVATMKHALVLAVAATACGEMVSSGPPPTVTYRARFSAPFSETIVYSVPRTGETISCTQRYDLTGDISVSVPRSEPFVNATGTLEVSLTGTGSSNESFCAWTTVRQTL